MFVFCIVLCRVAGFIVCGKLQKKKHTLTICRDIVRLGKQVFHFVYFEPNENLIIISGETF